MKLKQFCEENKDMRKLLFDYGVSDKVKILEEQGHDNVEIFTPIHNKGVNKIIGYDLVLSSDSDTNFVYVLCRVPNSLITIESKKSFDEYRLNMKNGMKNKKTKKMKGHPGSNILKDRLKGNKITERNV